MFDKHSVEELIEWRNAASNRVFVNEMIINDYLKKINKLDKKCSDDKIWISKLNRYLNKKCFGYKKQNWFNQ
jgi:hypothetical protein